MQESQTAGIALRSAAEITAGVRELPAAVAGKAQPAAPPEPPQPEVQMIPMRPLTKEQEKAAFDGGGSTVAKNQLGSLADAASNGPKIFPALALMVKMHFSEIILSRDEADELLAIQTELDKEHAIEEEHNVVLRAARIEKLRDEYAATLNPALLHQMRELDTLTPQDHLVVSTLSQNRARKICKERLAPLAVLIHERAAQAVARDADYFRKGEIAAHNRFGIVPEPSALVNGLNALVKGWLGPVPHWKAKPELCTNPSELIAAIIKRDREIYAPGPAPAPGIEATASPAPAAE